MADFDTAYRLTVAAEGGYSNDPDDKGGETKYGISKRAYPYLNIKSLTEAQAKAIYKRDYWDACSCDEIKSQDLANSIFDMAVNMGVGAVKKAFGEELLDIEEDLSRLTIYRISRYAKICMKNPRQKKFFFGWVCRALNVAGVK